jgi:hypothetical protein
MPSFSSSTGLSQRAGEAQAEILRIARRIAPHAEALTMSGRDGFWCYIAVDTDEEKKRIKDDQAILDDLRTAATLAKREPIYLTIESQEKVDRRWGGNWHQVWR